MEPLTLLYSHLLPILATCHDPRPPRRPQKIPSPFRASKAKRLQPQLQPMPLSLGFLPNSYIQEFCQEEANMIRVLCWSLQEEVPRETSYGPALPPALLCAEPAPGTAVRLAPLVWLPSPLAPGNSQAYLFHRIPWFLLPRHLPD